MCGIFGILSAAPAPANESVASALSLLAHRGPDGEGTWRRTSGSPAVTLAHRRLAIIDLTESAAQPMSNDDGSLRITYNGEIYNYVELMAELEAKGHHFHSRSDTEVLLRAYQEWGDRCLERLNGMFAFAIWDERRRELFAARDRFGEKPFHYVLDPNRGFFAFASEIKALVALPEVGAALDERALYRWVAFTELAGAEQTLWRGVKRLPNAHYLRLEWRGDAAGFGLKVRRYWDISLDRVERASVGEASRRFAELFADSVRLRLRSDVPVGTSLSGGLDSSAVVCQIRALGASGVQKTFSARMDDPALDEGRYIEAVLSATGVNGHEVWPTPQGLVEGFRKLCYHLEEPFIQTSQFAQHLVMRLASENAVTVLLDGQGADELLAGYTPYFATRYAQLADERRVLSLWREWRAFRALHSRPFPLPVRAAAARMAPGLRRALSRTRERPPAFPTGIMASWWSPEWLVEFADESPPELPPPGRDALTRRLYADAMRGELQELLRYGDRNSMAWSREVRQPFLDHRIAEMLFALPPELKLHNAETKVVLRKAVRGLVPEVIRRRTDKLGYQAPLPQWLKGDLCAWALEGLTQAAGQFGARIAPHPADRFARMVPTLDESAARPVFSLLTLAESDAALRAVGASAAATNTVR